MAVELALYLLGLTQLRHSASQRHVFACGSIVLADRLVCGLGALRAPKPHTIEKERTALPKAQYAICVSPITGYATIITAVR